MPEEAIYGQIEEPVEEEVALEPPEEAVTEQPEAEQPEDDDSNTWDEMYKELFGTTESAPERPTREDTKVEDKKEESEIDSLKAQVAEMSALLKSQVRESKLKEACKVYEENLPDWGEIKDDVLALAKKYGNTMGDSEYIALARAKKAGLDKPKPVALKKADTATAASAKRAVSEKPSGAGQNADREYASVDDAAMDALRELKAKKQ